MRRFPFLTAMLLAAAVPAGLSAQDAVVAQEHAAPVARRDVLAIAERVARHEIAAVKSGFLPPRWSWDTLDSRGWIQATLMYGLMNIADRSADPRYKTFLLDMGKANRWSLERTFYEANDHGIGQAYLWAAQRGAGREALLPSKARLDAILLNQPAWDSAATVVWPKKWGDTDRRPGDRYRWIDTYFFSPPLWFDMANSTGDARYRDYALTEFWASHDVLYDKAERLYYRDTRFIPDRDEKGRKVFWARGMGWVMGGLARMIERLPGNHPDRAKLVTVFRDVAGRLRELQKPEGTWTPALLSDATVKAPETSGTGLIVYGMAWGVKQGLLDRAAFEPAIRGGWTSLVRAVHPDGKLGFVQQVADKPENVKYGDTQYYGSGAFLLAAAAVADLDLKAAPGTRAKRR